MKVQVIFGIYIYTVILLWVTAAILYEEFDIQWALKYVIIFWLTAILSVATMGLVAVIKAYKKLI
jgi:hypothetical protein